MGYEMREGQGTLFRNEKTKDSQPDYNGTFMVNGTVYKIAGWIKEGQKGKFMSLKVEEKQQGGGGQGAPVRQRAAVGAGDGPFKDEPQSGFKESEIPF